MSSEPELNPPPHGFRIIPCTGVDLFLRHRMAPMGLIINARLDPSIMEATLWTLVEHKFPRAGARVACRNGIYELQIPDVFDIRNPPFVFTVENHPEMYHRDGRPEIPLGLTGSKPCVTPDPELAWLFQNPTCPRSLDDFIRSNVPSVHIYVTVFDDLTFLGFLAPHIMIDGIGIVTLLDAWTRLVRGDDIDTIRGMEWDAQPLAHFSSGPVKSDVPRGFFRPSSPLGLQETQEATPDELDPKDIPRFKIMDELQAQGSVECVGSADVLSAWWLKTVYGDRRLTDHTPIHIHMYRNLRDMPIFANDAPLAKPYIHNLILTSAVLPIPASAFQTESLGALALRIRRSIVAYNSDLEAICADLRWMCAGSGSNALEVLHWCPPGAEWVLQTNLRFGKLAELDFSGAVVGHAPKAAARVVFFYPFLITNPPSAFRGVEGVLMEDADVVWMRIGVRAKAVFGLQPISFINVAQVWHM
ncbi:hypothetical protein MSAN_01191600 [Mycena sanguinolenta]|uniref:Uncharacterized protein n=1 Tax=Mycena sanguinolenta TaxID=230812 RepID=A0A8H6YMU0_9AGAR|nr:hypothetical protein MSAN_01191600 [Mycena sanguinolenta]